MSKIETGVYTASKKDNTIYYRASLTYRKKHISLGSFDTFEAANHCYLFARKLLSENALEIEDYNAQMPIAFDKYVILINFRDNGIYFPTPIFLYTRFFLYYLSLEHVLKFDKDDLFYYSSHKIMVRKGHLFVADYGMQVNILNRYGIRNYAVLNRDYRFENGNEFDFRYENIIIINRFQGVTSHLKNSVPVYKSRIHIVGDYLIGIYKTETEAAIAYNKAIDILHKNGVTKKYTANYIDTISPKEYAEIYSALPISEKILHYFTE